MISLTGVNFSIKRKASLPKFIFTGMNSMDKKINFNELYSQVNTLIGLFHGVLVTKPLINKVRRAKVDRGNNGYLVKQIIKKRSWWSTTKEENLHLCLIWTEHLLKKNIPKEKCFRLLESNEDNIVFQRNF